jgi:NADPH:quinone reductase-like Zn-dependent oxidoreductase
MKAIVITTYGSPDVLQMKDVETPSPKDNEVLIKIYATSVTVGDLWARNFKAISPGKFSMPLPFWLPARLYFGFSKPKVKILGAEVAGEVEAVGKNVKRFKSGDAVFGYPGQSMGAYAEYMCMPEDGFIALKPSNMTYEEAAVVPYGAITALNLLEKVDLRPGQKILINGASGGIGSAAVQLAKHHFGAHVTGVCGTPRVQFVRSLGTDKVIDYTMEDFTQNGETYDVIFDIQGRCSFARCRKSLTPNGILLYASFKMKQVLQMLWTSKRGGPRVICALATGGNEYLLAAKELIEAGKIKAIIDQCFPLEQAAQAHRYVEDGRKQGHVVITIDRNR